MKAKTADRIATSILYLISGFIVLLLAVFIIYIIYRGMDSLNFDFLFGKPKMDQPGGGIGPQLFNSFYMLIVSLLITIPLGLKTLVWIEMHYENIWNQRVYKQRSTIPYPCTSRRFIRIWDINVETFLIASKHKNRFYPSLCTPS